MKLFKTLFEKIYFDFHFFGVAFILIIYLFLFIISKNFPYFWDNILQTSIEAHKFYLTNFQFTFQKEIPQLPHLISTGYHPPILGLLTALLWKIMGYKLWVSHALALVSSVILLYHLNLLLKHLIENKWIVWVLLIIMLEPTILTQFVIASPDFFILTAFVVSLRAIIEKKYWILSFALVFLFGMSMRGVFLGIVLFIAHLLYHFWYLKSKFTWVSLFKIGFAYIPIFALLLIYYAIYFVKNGWFFTGDSGTSHYATPQNFKFIVKHFLDFGVRSVENGRIVISILGLILLYKFFKNKLKFNELQKFIGTVLLLHFIIYFVFIFLIQVPFSGRYFMPHYILLIILVFSNFIMSYADSKKYKLILLILFMELTGHFWLYPEPISKAWDSTLAHLPYYQLREETFQFLEREKIEFSDVSADFCISGNQKYADLKSHNQMISNDLDNSYYLYSNISNHGDEILMEIDNKQHWKPIKRFYQFPVEIIVYERIK